MALDAGPLLHEPDWDQLDRERDAWRAAHPPTTYVEALFELSYLERPAYRAVIDAWSGEPAELLSLVVAAAERGPVSVPQAEPDDVSEWLAAPQPLYPAGPVAFVAAEASRRPAESVGATNDSVAPRPTVFSAIAAPDAVDRWAIEGFLRAGSWGLLASTPGLGKTQMLREIALRVATGTGRVFERYSIPRPLRTLVIDEENGPPEEWRREEMIRLALAIERKDVSTYFRTSWLGLDLLDPVWQSRLEGWIEELGIELLILDAISDMYSVKELREYLTPIGTFFKHLLLRFPTLAILASHHLRKMPPGEAQAERMLSDLRGGFWDQQSQMVALAWSLGERRIRLALRKRVPNHDGIFEQTDSGLMRFLADANERPAANDDRVTACIDAGAESVGDVVVATGLPERTVWNAVRRLRKARILTPKGKLERPLEDRG